MAKAQAVDAVLLGAVGGPKYDKLDFSVKPERGLLRLRKEMDLFSNLRPAQCFDALADFSSLKKEVVAGLDIVIVRELTSGVYFGEPRGIFTGRQRARGHQHPALHRIEIAPRGAVGLRAGAAAGQQGLLDGEGQRDGIGHPVARGGAGVHDNEYPDVALTHMYADNGAMQLVRWPKQFDVIVTDNLFGDVLSDCAAMLTGSLGMLPSASLGAPMANGRPKALYEPVHGSAPDIAGTGKANPIACILSFAMALRYSFDHGRRGGAGREGGGKGAGRWRAHRRSDGPRGRHAGDHARDGRGDHRRAGRKPLGRLTDRYRGRQAITLPPFRMARLEVSARR